MAKLYEYYYPKARYMDVTKIDNDNLKKDDMLAYLYSILQSDKHKVTTSPEILAFNRFCEQGLRMIIQSGFAVDKTIINNRNTTDTDKTIKSFRIQVSFLDTYLDTPKKIDKDGRKIPKNPDDYRIQNDSYFANLIITAKISITAYKIDGSEEIKETIMPGLNISAIPIMLRSSHCNTYKLSTEMLRNINEDPSDTGGYFITGGKEYFINATENITFNKPLIFKSTLKTQKVYATILSQSGGIYGNSTQLTVYINTDNTINIEFQTYQFAKVKIPFYVIYRLFGINSDREIAKMIVYEMDQKTSESEQILEYITKGFLADYKQDKKMTQMTTNGNLEKIYTAIHTLENPNAYKKNEDAVKFVINDIRKKLDVSILPHVGKKDISRPSKLLHISSLIRDAIMVDMGLRQEDDRDHYTNKRGHGAAISLAKTTKTLFNSKIIAVFQTNLIGECTTKSFETINITDIASSIRTNIQGNELQNAFIKYINASEKESTRIKEKIRMSAQSLEREELSKVVDKLVEYIRDIKKENKKIKKAINELKNDDETVTIASSKTNFTDFSTLKIYNDED